MCLIRRSKLNEQASYAYQYPSDLSGGGGQPKGGCPVGALLQLDACEQNCLNAVRLTPLRAYPARALCVG